MHNFQEPTIETYTYIMITIIIKNYAALIPGCDSSFSTVASFINLNTSISTGKPALHYNTV